MAGNITYSLKEIVFICSRNFKLYPPNDKINTMTVRRCWTFSYFKYVWP